METPDGIRFEGSYQNDVRHGDFIEKDRNGNVIRRGHYTNGILDR
jgi:antitoxin component YwqK of YwqJK toxin-antitoxin module